MKLFSTILLCLFSYLLFGQDWNRLKISKFRISFEASILNAQAKIGRTKPDTPTPEISFSFQSNLYYLIQPSKISLYTGIGYRKINQILRENSIEIPYSEEHSIEDNDGNIISSYGYAFYSGFGNLDLEIKMLTNQLNDGFDYKEGDIIEMEYAANLYIEAITIPIAIQYNLVNKKNSLFLKVGGILNFMRDYNISKQQLKLRNFFINRANIQRGFIKEVLIERGLKNFKKFVPELLVAGGIESRIHSRLSIFGNLEYTIPLSPFYADGMISTSFNTFSLSIGTKFFL